MAKPRDPIPSKTSPGGWRPCTRCGRYGGEQTDPDENGVRRMVTAPFDSPKIKPGQSWTCRICLRAKDEAPADPGHPMPDAA